MSAERGGRSRWRPGALWRGPLLLLLGLGCVVAAAWLEGPVVVRAVWSRIGVQRVEVHAAHFREAGAESGVDPCLLAAICYVESRGRVDAVSSAGALGLFQLMPSAAADAARRLRLASPTRAELLADARLNTRLAARHLAWLADSLGPDATRILVAYNAGRGRLLEWEKASGGWEAWYARRSAEGGSPVLAYAADVLEFAERFRERGVVLRETAPGETPGLSGGSR